MTIVWILTGINVVVCILSTINMLKVQKDIRMIQELILKSKNIYDPFPNPSCIVPKGFPNKED